MVEDARREHRSAAKTAAEAQARAERAEAHFKQLEGAMFLAGQRRAENERLLADVEQRGPQELY